MQTTVAVIALLRLGPSLLFILDRIVLALSVQVIQIHMNFDVILIGVTKMNIIYSLIAIVYEAIILPR